MLYKTVMIVPAADVRAQSKQQGSSSWLNCVFVLAILATSC
jgi:hypothetical protein